MSGHTLYFFNSIFDFIPLDLPNVTTSIHLVECEIYILWVLGKEGPMSIYALAQKSIDLPEINPLYPYVSEMEYWKERMMEDVRRHDYPLRRHDYHLIYTKVKELIRKKLIQKQKMSAEKSTHESKTIVGLTFLGFVFYLQNLKPQNQQPPLESPYDKFNQALKKYNTLIPLSQCWGSMVKEIEEAKIKKAVEKTLEEFNNIRYAIFRLRQVDLKFKGFSEYRNIFPTRNKDNVEIIWQKDNEVVEYLRRKEALVLRNSYIAYLLVDDISTLKRKDKIKLEEISPKLTCERELAYIENRDVGLDSIFKGKRLREFLPEYAGIEYFFTGIFVKNLLWTEKNKTEN